MILLSEPVCSQLLYSVCDHKMFTLLFQWRHRKHYTYIYYLLNTKNSFQNHLGFVLFSLQTGTDELPSSCLTWNSAISISHESACSICQPFVKIRASSKINMDKIFFIDLWIFWVVSHGFFSIKNMVFLTTDYIIVCFIYVYWSNVFTKSTTQVYSMYIWETSDSILNYTCTSH